MSNLKYEFTGETRIAPDGTTLHQIRALRDIDRWGVKAGDTGGWIASEASIARVYGDAWVYGDAQVYGNARVYGNAWVSGDAQVYGNAQVYGDAQVYGNAWVYGDAQVYGNARVSGDARVYGDAHKTSPLYIQGSRHSLTRCKVGHIQIGCHCHTIDWWLEHYKAIGRTERYTKKQIEEYGLYIQLFEALEPSTLSKEGLGTDGGDKS